MKKLMILMSIFLMTSLVSMEAVAQTPNSSRSNATNSRPAATATKQSPSAASSQATRQIKKGDAQLNKANNSYQKAQQSAASRVPRTTPSTRARQPRRLLVRPRPQSPALRPPPKPPVNRAPLPATVRPQPQNLRIRPALPALVQLTILLPHLALVRPTLRLTSPSRRPRAIRLQDLPRARLRQQELRKSPTPLLQQPRLKEVTLNKEWPARNR